MKKRKLYTFIALNINIALDTGKYLELDTETIKNRISEGNIFDFLETTLGKDIDFSNITKEEKEYLVNEWQEFSCIDECKKFGADNYGLCLILAYILEGIQRLNN